MKGSRSDPSAGDAWDRAKDDEPRFALLGRDPAAASLVRLWAIARHREGEREEVVNEALAIADAMDEYAESIGQPVVRITFGGMTVTTDRLRRKASVEASYFDQPNGQG